MITPENTSTQHCGTTAAEESFPEWLPLAGGAALAFLALSRKRTLFGLGALLGGGYLLYRAIDNGTIRLPKDLESLGVPADLARQLRQQWETQMSPAASDSPAGNRDRDWPRREDIDEVDEASMESFPGSDPPARW